MANVVLSNRAEQDLSGIWRSIAVDNEPAADRLLRQLEKKMSRLADFPGIGAPRPELRLSARILISNPYLILYERDEANDVVLIVTVVDGRRDLQDFL